MKKNIKEPKIELSKENIEKALRILNLDPSEFDTKSFEKGLISEEDLKKGEFKSEDATDESKEKNSKAESKEKRDSGEIGKKDEEEDVDRDSESTKKSDDDDDEDDDVKKSMGESAEAKRQIAEDLERSIDVNIRSLSTLNDDILKSLQRAFEKIEEVEIAISGRIEKAFGTVGDKLEKAVDASEKKLVASDTLLKAIDERLAKVENTPNPRKSVTSQRFLKKGSSEESPNESREASLLSLSRDRTAISNLLMRKSGIETGQVNSQYENAVLSYESGGQLSKAVMDDLSRSEGIKFTS